VLDCRRGSISALQRAATVAHMAECASCAFARRAKAVAALRVVPGVANLDKRTARRNTELCAIIPRFVGQQHDI